MSRRLLGPAFLGAVSACGGPPAAKEPPPAAPSSIGAPASSVSSAAASSATVGPANPPAPRVTPAAGTGTPCGELGCLSFASPREAFEHALRGEPRIIALGEAHAQKVMGNVETTARRFARELLPALPARVKGLVVELLVPTGRCQQQEKAVEERTKPVTAQQKETNQNEFVALGFEAKKRGIRAEPLIPTCDELKSVLTSPNDVGALLELIATVTARETGEFIDKMPAEQGIAIYGGLLHNDFAPAPEHETWSFGPRLAARASYVEIDLIVPELIRDGAPWSKLAWFSAYDLARDGKKTILFQPGLHSFVLIFPQTASTEGT